MHSLPLVLLSLHAFANGNTPITGKFHLDSGDSWCDRAFSLAYDEKNQEVLLGDQNGQTAKAYDLTREKCEYMPFLDEEGRQEVRCFHTDVETDGTVSVWRRTAKKVPPIDLAKDLGAPVLSEQYRKGQKDGELLYFAEALDGYPETHCAYIVR